MEYIYLLQLREHVNKEEGVYKIGRTKQTNLKRFQSYPKNSKLYLLISVEDCVSKEKDIIGYFRRKYKQRRDIGLEYFEGDKCKMMEDIMNEKYINKSI